MKRRILWIFSLCAGVFCMGVLAAFVSAGFWLQRQDNPERSDAILVLAGNALRAIYAADLYLKGYAPKVYVSKPAREPERKMVEALNISMDPQEEIYRQVLIKKGVPSKSILLFGRSSTSTVEEALAARKLFKGRVNCRLLVVTSPYHTTRTRMIFKDTLPECEVRVVGTIYESFPRKWWHRQGSAVTVIMEISKIAYYKIGGRFFSENGAPQ